MPETIPNLPDLEEIFQAADAYSEAMGNFDYAIGDLHEILRVTWAIMTPDQRTAVFAQPELVRLAELPEFEFLIAKG